MDILSFGAGYVLGRKDKGGKHPDTVIYTDSDSTYSAPDTAQNETFDTFTEVWNNDDPEKIVRRVWGVGVLNKGKENERVTRLVYPDKTFVTLVNF